MSTHRGRAHPAHGDLDVEQALREERAAALGRAGRKVQAAVESYRVAVAAGGMSAREEDHLLDEVAASVYRLLLQRECAGARRGNLDAICSAYDVPTAVRGRI